MKTRRASIVIAMAALLPLGLAACGSDASTTDAGSGTSATSSAPAPETSTTTEAAAAGENFGAGCAAVPADGAGSFAGMATEPVANAASANPLLKTLVGAVTAAGLVDTLNAAPAITVFAPVNDAFAAIPKADLDAVLADKPTLTKVLTNHVIEGKLSPDMLAGDHKTLAGTTITVKGSGEDFTVGSADAKVICGNVQTANATVYIIDGVLLPS